ncbi:uncharacterized protein L199_004153 [Kwoniella botswanensis]|uniref:uncharacterized protein n=1 Tax=Kwoniella botswanensis TaxID=1268659 RepID=UPI00315CB5AB
MPYSLVHTNEVNLQPSDRTLLLPIGSLPEDIQYSVISAFATLSFENLKCVSSLNSRFRASFNSLLFHSITLSDEDAHILKHLCPPRLQSAAPPVLDEFRLQDLHKSKNQYTRFCSICSSARNLSIVGETILEVIAQMLEQEGTTNFFPQVEQLVFRNTKKGHGLERISMDTSIEHSLGKILTTIQPRKLCLNLGIPFSHTWHNLVQNLADGGLGGIQEIVHHGVPISNMKVEFLILEGVAIQRFFLEDYVIPSYSQTTLKVIYRWASPRNDLYIHRTIPQEIHVYADWRGSYGLPLELVDSPIEDMWELKKVTHIQQADEKVECECCSSQKL